MQYFDAFFNKKDLLMEKSKIMLVETIQKISVEVMNNTKNGNSKQLFSIVSTQVAMLSAIYEMISKQMNEVNSKSISYSNSTSSVSSIDVDDTCNDHTRTRKRKHNAVDIPLSSCSTSCDDQQASLENNLLSLPTKIYVSYLHSLH